MSHKLEIKNLHVAIEDKEILKGIDLIVKTGETHALMGPNGNGKSTLLMAIMGHPKYEITKGDILFDGKSILESPVDERSRMGIFLALQNPQTIPGVSNLEFLKYIVNAHSETKQKLPKIFADIKEAAKELNFDVNMLKRSVNDGFSGGEKKKNEILQMKLLKPKFALIDEIDSGLDVDALEIVSQNLNSYNKAELGMIIVSHYDRFFNKVPPTHAHVIIDGKIVVSGDSKIVERINKEGYSWAKTKQNS
ncbi:Fe-S cluster assembly ATPase SufC [Spiroplasma alleghenense]|uniref:FeS assembly ATPase SufC n=1 Tax=Spiroplasma alleghenense TaxID=216931 RepID=A0A345Z3Z3_9MOLU|nr:Fe-S cluster assembly ATPase SufC [Spiroplasma alleghenense]AXK51322.1 FeS assembly ATPase SufC [Spiroplasma alleghenense]